MGQSGEEHRAGVGERLVMVATDGSVEALAAAATAAELLPSAASFRVVTVVEEPLQPGGDATGFAAPVLDADEFQELIAERRVEADAINAATARMIGDRPIIQRVLHGRAIDELSDEATSCGADLIVVGAHSGIGSSVASGLLREGVVPVLICPGRSPNKHATV